MMYPKRLSNSQYYNFVAMVAERHQCRLVDIDFPGRTIELTGLPAAVHSCSAELAKLLGTAPHSLPESRRLMHAAAC